MFSSACVVVDSQGHIVREEKRFTVAGAPDLRLDTFDGSIDIRTGDDARAVVIEIERRGPTQEAIDQVKVDTRQEGDRIDVDVKKPNRDVTFFGIGHLTPSANLIITMPKTGNVVARSGDGAMRIEGVRGRLDLHTGDGSIRGRDVGGQMSIVTGDGSVTLDSAEGDLDVDTGDGSVSVTGKLGTVKLHTGDGSITLRADPGTVMKSDWSVTTGDGGVAVSLPSGFGAELDAHTGDGSIRNDLDLRTESAGENSRRTVRGRLGAGGKTLTIRTGDGSIRLKMS
jgi:hypothetical protein